MKVKCISCGHEVNLDHWVFDNDVTPSDWTNVIEYWTGSPARDGQKGSCHEKAEVVQFRIQASSC
jgi:hypothetical protein